MLDYSDIYNPLTVCTMPRHPDSARVNDCASSLWKSSPKQRHAADPAR